MQPPLFDQPPERICVLRLSALGDVCHVLPVVRTLQDAWPGVAITWIIGRLEHKLLGHLPDVEFVVFDKKVGAAAYRELDSALRAGMPEGSRGVTVKDLTLTPAK